LTTVEEITIGGPKGTLSAAEVARRIGLHVAELRNPAYTSSSTSICRYGYIPEFMNTLEYVESELEELGFSCHLDAVGNLVARNVPPDTMAYGLGSHCDSNRNGGAYDGMLGVVVAIEAARLNHDLGLGLPLEIIAFAEEEGSGFGQLLLGSSVMCGLLDEEDLRHRLRAIDDGDSFWEHCRRAGLDPSGWAQSRDALEHLHCFFELHIEQGRWLQDNGHPLGIVDSIAGWVQSDATVSGQASHAGGAAMDLRRDAGAGAVQIAASAEHHARMTHGGVVATVGDIRLDPGLINVVPGAATLTFDIRGVHDSEVAAVEAALLRDADEACRSRSLGFDYAVRRRVPSVEMDQHLRSALEESALGLGMALPHLNSGAAHDSMVVAKVVPTAMLFVPCLDGISHAPEESAHDLDAALAALVLIEACTLLAKQGPE
jgi:hydantoinase/carbamoylase family amidase